MTEVVIVPTSPGRYAARLGGDVIVKSSRDPEHAAARALLARGITGRMTTVRTPGGTPQMRFDIETAAQFTVAEDDAGLHLRRWKPFPSVNVEA